MINYQQKVLLFGLLFFVLGLALLVTSIIDIRSVETNYPNDMKDSIEIINNISYGIIAISVIFLIIGFSLMYNHKSVEENGLSGKTKSYAGYISIFVGILVITLGIVQRVSITNIIDRKDFNVSKDVISGSNTGIIGIGIFITLVGILYIKFILPSNLDLSELDIKIKNKKEEILNLERDFEGNKAYSGEYKNRQKLLLINVAKTELKQLENQLQKSISSEEEFLKNIQDSLEQEEKQIQQQAQVQSQQQQQQKSFQVSQDVKGSSLPTLSPKESLGIDPTLQNRLASLRPLPSTPPLSSSSQVFPPSMSHVPQSPNYSGISTYTSSSQLSQPQQSSSMFAPKTSPYPSQTQQSSSMFAPKTPYPSSQTQQSSSSMFAPKTSPYPSQTQQSSSMFAPKTSPYPSQTQQSSFPPSKFAPKTPSFDPSILPNFESESMEQMFERLNDPSIDPYSSLRKRSGGFGFRKKNKK